MAKWHKRMYDGIVVFESPINISDGRDGGIITSIYGLLYDKYNAHNEDLFTWQLNRYITYLMSIERIQDCGGEIDPDSWTTPDGEIVPLNSAYKNYVYRLLRESMIGYKLMEFDFPLNPAPEEHSGDWITSDTLIKRFISIQDNDEEL